MRTIYNRMAPTEFAYGLISGVVATLVGFVFAAGWDLWKERRRESHERQKAIHFLQREIAVNIQILDANYETLEKDTEAAKQQKEVVIPLSLLETQVWQSTRLSGFLASLRPDLAREIDLTYSRSLIYNQKIQWREFYRLTNQAMDNYARRRELLNGFLLGESAELLTRFGKHSEVIKQKTLR